MPSEPIDVPPTALVLLIGAAGSGKSTLAARHFSAEAIVSSDQLRAVIGRDESDQTVNEAVFQRLHQWVDHRLRAGALAIVDATNTEWIGRVELLRIARRYGRPAVALVLDLPAETCMARNWGRSRTVKPSVVRRQVAEIRRDVGRLDLEGFGSVHVLRSTAEIDQVRVRIADGTLLC